MYSLSKIRLTPVILLSLLAGALLIGAFYTEHINSIRYQNAIRSETQNQLNTIRDHLQANLSGDIQLVRGLIATISMDPEMDQKQFEKAAAIIFSESTQLLKLAAAPDNIVRLMYPLKGNEAVVNLDYRTRPDQIDIIEQARKSRKVALAGPVNLIKGGTGFIARHPIFIPDSSGVEEYWGVISAVISQEQLFKSSQLSDPALPIDIAIRGKDSTGPTGELFYGSVSIFQNNPVLSEIKLPNGSWQLAAIPNQKLVITTENKWPLRVGYAAVAFIFLGVFLSLLRTLRLESHSRSEAEAARAESAIALAHLNERETLLRTVIDEMPDVVLLKDSEGRFLLGNQAVAQLYNTTPEQMVGKFDTEFGIPDEISNFYRENIKEIMARGITEVVYEDSKDTVNNEIRHFKSIKKPFKDGAGNNQILVIAHDITDLIQAQQKVTESEEKLNTVLDNVDAYIYLKDRNGNYQFANRKVRELWQADIDQIVGFGDDKFFDAKTSANIRSNDRQVLIEGKTIRAEETNAIPETGQITTFQSTKIPLRHDDGSIYALCGISVDISEMKQIEQALRESEQRFKIAGMAAYDLIYEWDVATDTLTWFGDIDNILGFEQGEISHDIPRWLSLVHPDDRSQLIDAVELHRIKTTPINYEYRIRHKDGQYLYWSDRALPLLDQSGQPYKWIGVCTDITNQKQQQSQLEFTAYHDMLTNLPNRTLLADRLQQAITQEARRGQHLAVVYIDLDGFKEVNDNHGHAMGDRLLIEIGHRLHENLREGDTIARLGGDEFVAVLIDLDDTLSTIPLLQRLLRSVAQPVQVDDLLLQVSASLGVAMYPQADEVDADLLIRQADQAMYQAKLAGKNQYYFFDTEQDRTLRGRRDMLDQVSQALKQNQFVLYYQPKVNMRSGDVVGVEALIRWQHPEQGLLTPAKFLPLIDDQALAAQLGNWVIRTALQQAEQWLSNGIDIQISVNISGSHLLQDNFIDELKQHLLQHPTIKPHNLELEVLESSALADMMQVSKVIKACKKIGVSFALDDFGTGYSSLTYLKYLPAAVLKIDQSFVRDMHDDPDDLAILEGIMGMSSAFRRQVVAEGVELIEQGEMLLQLGCEVAQGYFIAKPMPAEQLPDWYHSWKPPLRWQQQQRISRDDLSLLFASIEHRSWINSIQKYLHGEMGELPPIEHTRCRFGRWLKGEGIFRYGNQSIFDEIEKQHLDIHTLGKELIDLYHQGDKHQAVDQIDELHRRSNQLQLELNELLLLSSENA